MADQQSNSPVENYVTTNRFYVEIGENLVASFSECSGGSIDIDKQVYLEGGVNDQPRISLGQTRFADITLKRGTTNDNTFSEWISELFDDEQITQRRNVNILTYNQAGEVVKSWNLIGAIPVSWKLSSLEADGNAVAVEELTLAFEGLKVSNEAGSNSTINRDNTGFFAISSWGDNQLGIQQSSSSNNGNTSGSQQSSSSSNGNTSGSQQSSSSNSPQQNIEQIAQQYLGDPALMDALCDRVYELLRADLRLQRERLGNSSTGRQ